MQAQRRSAKTRRFAALKHLIGCVLFGGMILVIAYDWLGIGGPGLGGAINGAVYDATPPGHRLDPRGGGLAGRAMQLADARMYARKESRRLAWSVEALDREPVEQRR